MKSVIGLVCLALAPAVLSGQTVTINSPTSGTVVTPGEWINGSFNVSGFTMGLQYVFVSATDTPYVNTFGPFSQTATGYNGSISYTIPVSALEGDTIRISVVAYAWDGNTQVSDRVNLIVDDFDPPANDSFADAEALSSTSGSLTASNRGATREADEPMHVAWPGGRSVWWKWIAPANGTASFVVASDSSHAYLDAYVGSSIDNLVSLDEDLPTAGDYYRPTTRDQHPIYPEHFAEFSVTEGTTYYIAVDGYEGAFGEFSLTWTFVAGSSVNDWMMYR